jgi:AraC-like DNA-binding protein
VLHFTRYNPAPGLEQLIQGYWLLESAGQAEQLQLVPDGYPELFFALQGQVQIFSEQYRWGPEKSMGIIGQVAERFAFEVAAHTRVLYVKLFPWAPYRLFGVPAWMLNNCALEIGDVSARGGFQQLSRQIQDTPDVQQAVALLNRFFLKKLPDLPAGHAFTAHAIRQIFRRHGALGIQELSQQVRVSRRYVEKTFKEQIGMSPKAYARLIRVKKATVSLLQPRFNGRVADLVSQLDYYDHSHFLRDFKAITGQTPGLFLQEQLNFTAESAAVYLQQWDYS